MKRFLLASLAGFITNSVGYNLLEGLIFKDYMKENVYDVVGVELGSSPVPLVAVALMAIIMAYLYPRGYEGGAPAAEGIRFGLLIGLFAGVPYGVFFGTLFSLGFGPIAMISILMTVEVAISGLVIGLVYGRSEKAAAAA